MIDQLIHKIKLRQSAIQVSLASGSAATWDSYHRMVGENFGLESVMNMIDAMLDEEKKKD